MLMELLAAIESHKGSAMPDVMRRLEGGVKTLMQQDAAEAEPEPAAAQGTAQGTAQAPVQGTAEAPPSPAAIAAAVENVAARTPLRGRILTVVAKPAKMAETTGRLALAPKPEDAEMLVAEEAVADELEADAASLESEPEAIEEIAMSGAGEIVADPAQEPEAKAEAKSPETATPSPKEQELVNALLDAEKRLIEAEALASAANANSPVAEIIRRISQRTREITDSGTPRA
jgi:hypothetical protein